MTSSLETGSPINAAHEAPEAALGGRRGKGFLALAATMFWPGTGQFLAGRRRRGLLWFAAAVVLGAVGITALIVPRFVPATIVIVPLAVLFHLAGWVDAYRSGRRSPRRMLGTPPVRYGVGALLLLLALFASPSVPLALFVRARFAQTFIVPTASMSPTFVPGDRFVCHKRVEPQRWDVVALRAPDEGFGRDVYVERLVGLPGEQIELHGNAVYVNGERIVPPAGIGPYESKPRDPSAPRNGCEGNPIRLGPDEYYFLGDNSPISGDSRYWRSGSPGHQPGTVGRADIIGVGTYLYWPPARWRRLDPTP